MLEILSKPEELFEMIYATLGDDYDGAVGLRGCNTQYKVGKKLRKSHRWDDGNMTRDILDGTSAIVISADWAYDSRSTIINNIAKHAQRVAAYGQYVMVIAGGTAKGGNDIGEIIIPDAKVILTL
jgi:hypothetical protein